MSVARYPLRGEMTLAQLMELVSNEYLKDGSSSAVFQSGVHIDGKLLAITVSLFVAEVDSLNGLLPATKIN